MRGVLFAVLWAACFVSGPTAAQVPQTSGQTPKVAQERLYESLRRELIDKLQASGRFSGIATVNRTTLKARALDGAEIVLSIDAVANDVSRGPGQREAIVAKFVRAAVESVAPKAPAISRADFISSLRVVVRAKGYLGELLAQKASPGPLWRPLAGDALLFVAIDHGERLKIALAGAGAEYGVSDDEMFLLGREQLKRFLGSVETEDAAGVRALSVSDDAYSPSLLLLDDPWAKVEKDFGSDFVVAIPDRNTLLAAPAKNAAQLRKVVELVTKSRKSSPMISDLLQRSGGGWISHSGR